MKYYVIFKEKQYHKLGSIELGPNNVAVFDVDSRVQGQNLVSELFGTNVKNHDAWALGAINQHVKAYNKTFVDINSEI
jgi:hypothetical protein